jgi:sortase (surface protein transpeptidase)
MSNTQSKKEKEKKERKKEKKSNFRPKSHRTTKYTPSREEEYVKTNQICGGITITTIGVSNTRRQKTTKWLMHNFFVFSFEQN